MADISKCNGHECDRREQCYRHTAPDSQRQSWMEFWNEPKPCSEFIDNSRDTTSSLRKEE